MKNKIFIFLLLLILINMSGCKKNIVVQGDDNVQGTLIIGNTTQLTGDFWSQKWGNNSVDNMVRDLIHGYNTVTYKIEKHLYDIDYTVVRNVEVIDNSDKTKTYVFTINNNLYWNDKIKITAKDYVFSVLLGSNSALNELGIDSTDGMYFVGYDRYMSGYTDFFEGVHYIDTNTFSLTINDKYLPYYYENFMVGVQPVPMHVIIPNGDIKDNVEGAQIICDDFKNTITETLLNSKTGYRFFPKVTCGPYNLEEFSITTKIAILKCNPCYVGDYNGQIPNIEKLIIKKTDEATQIDELIAGTVDILPNVIGSEGINGGLKAYDEGKIQSLSYPRNGYRGLAMNCNYGPTKYVKVRQAIAYCLDKNEIVRQYSGGYASIVHSMYGISQNMYKDNKGKIDTELNKYLYNLKEAVTLLEQDGWIYNSKGENYDKKVDNLRYKLVDDKLIPLEIKHLTLSDNQAFNIVTAMLKNNLEEIGFKYEAIVVDFSTLYKNIYCAENKYNIFSYGCDFNSVFDPYISYIADEGYFGVNNYNHLKDFELMRLANELRKTEFGEEELYSKKWFYFQKRWNKILPDIPIYSDTYYCFYSKRVKNYNANADWNIQKAIIYASVE